ncbi:type II toxin-antitoxin system VapC family toxin [Aeromicrobium sp. 9AM]|uniref:type II toxin-antitoxin system VapC family toxin n=1 Tax=Aeromicrobium sp. 9AM TaxID=2653126 RepID=UPI0012F1992F|nr:type II toxin-antitoxin system VapC family toxin [Aeromicrobium sp. 9AM]VXB36077.1 Ribonuclease VapC [Aeromicrobium sp. 9AM]
MIILDTNVISELMRGGSAEITRWLASVRGDDLHTTVITRAEIGYGIARLPDGRRRDQLRGRARTVFAQIADRTLSLDVAAADRYGELVAARERSGRPISAPGAQIASIAFVHGATVATRNTADFADCGVDVVNPFAA